MAEFKKYIDTFKNPPREFRPVSMWFWCDDMRKDEITFQLEEFKKQGMNDVFVNAVWGLGVEYLSDEYFEYVKYCVDECKRLGMNYWIYDEFNWPSGNAGGKLLSKYPWAVGKLLKCEQFYVWAGNCADTISTGRLVAAQILLVTPDGFDVIDIMDKVKVEITDTGDTKVTYRNLEYNSLVRVQYFFSMPDPHILTTSVWYKYANYEAGYIDTFNVEAVNKFLELTHERYKQYVGDEFGKTVKGVFTDEICLASPFSIGENRIPWSEHFAEKFKKLNGYDIVPYLYCLFNGTLNKHDRKIRNDYFNTAKTLYLENFVKPMYDWCDKNGIAFTGHFDGEESLTWHLMQSADLISSFKYMHIPGIDSIVPPFKIDDKNYNVAGKVLNSIAKYYDRDRTLCETYTGSGWDVRFDTMKRIGNRLMTLGVNMIHYMGAYYSWDGMLKIGPTSYPPSHGYNNPMWQHYGKLGDYFARIQSLSAATKGGSKVLFMAPLVQAKIDLDLSKNIFNYLKDDFAVRYLDEIMEATVTASMRLGVDLDLISEDGAPDIKAKDGLMTYLGHTYEYIIFPAMAFINKETAELIARLDKAGVKMIFVNTLPVEVIDADVPALKADFGGKSTVFENDDASYEVFKKKNVSMLTVKKRPLVLDGYRETLAKVFKPADIALSMKSTGNIFIGHRENKDIDLYFVSNDDNACNEMRIPKKLRGLEILSPDTGDLKTVYTDGNDIVIPFAPYELVVIVKSKKESFANIADFAKKAEPASVTELTSGFTFTPEKENALRCSWKFNYKGKFLPVNFFYFPEWQPNTLNMPYELEWDLKIESMPEKIFFNAEIKGVKEITINGKKLPFERNIRIWGLNNFRAEATKYFKEGDNVVRFKAVTPDWVGIHALPFAFITGDFLVTPDDVVHAVKSRAVKLGSLDPQGYKYFSGNGSYKVVFPARKGKKTFVELDTREVVGVKINGVLVKEIMWQPRRAEITKFVKNGLNELELVMTATYANLLAEQPANHGISGVKIITY